MRKYNFALLFLLLSSMSFAQNWETLPLDSLDQIFQAQLEAGAYSKAQDIAKNGLDRAAKKYGKKDSIYSRFNFFYASALNKMGKYADANPYYKTYLQLEADNFGDKSPQHAIALHNYATFCKSAGRLLDADTYLVEAASILEKNKKDHWEEYAKLQVSLGDVKSVLGEEEAAETYLKKAMKLIEENADHKHPDYLFCMNNLAVLYSEMGRYEEAEKMYIEVNDLYGEVYGKDHPYYALSYNNLGGLFWRLKDYKKAAEVYEIVLERLEGKLPNSHPWYLMAEDNLASMYEELGRVEEAEKISNRVVKTLKATVGEEHPKYIQAINNLAFLYQSTDRWEEAKALLQKELELRTIVHGKKHPDYAMNLVSLATVYIHLRQLDSVQTLLYDALRMNSKSLEVESKIEQPYSRFIPQHQFISHIQLMGALDKLGSYHKYQFENSQDLKELKYSFDAFYSIVLYAEQKNNAFLNDQDKLRIMHRAAGAASKALEIASLIEDNQGRVDQNLIFQLTDFNKSALLSQALQASKVQQLWTLPDRLRQQEQEIKQEANDLERAFVEATNFKEEAKIKDIRQKIIQNNRKEEQLLDQLKEEFPRYYAAQYQRPYAQIKDFQQFLTEDQLLIEYFMDDTALIVFAVGKEELDFDFGWYHAKELIPQIEDFRKSISDYDFLNDEPEKSIQMYLEKAHILYEKLLSKTLKKFPNKKELILIPDGILGHIPFEALLTKEVEYEKDPSFLNLPYLLKDYQITYSYSAAILSENHQHKNKKGNKKIFAFAASYKGKANEIATRANRSPSLRNLRDVLQPLPSVQKEVQALEGLFPGIFLYKDAANEFTFKEKANEYSIIHLAMHGILNEKHPILSSLAFSENGDSLEDNFLHAYEISNMQLNADLVVLSACETGYGKFESGEGVMSLARSFMYAGVPSLVVSLWQVNDASTAIIMECFYKQLANGQNKAAALQQAKLQYIALAAKENPLAAHPAFWAAFIQLGDPGALQFSTATSWRNWLWLISIPILAIIGFLALRSRKKREV